jgi:orotate phosphoribosyltransferase
MHPLVRLAAGRSGHFQFEAGHHGDLWLDLDALLREPYRLRPYIRALAAHLTSVGVDAVCGPMVGGAFVAQLVALKLDVPFTWTDRLLTSDGNVRYVLPGHAGRWLRGKQVAVVDDAINAGSAIGGTLAALRASGARPVAIGALLALGEVPARFAVTARLPLFAVANVESHLWLPADCSRCQEGIPLENVAT